MDHFISRVYFKTLLHYNYKLNDIIARLILLSFNKNLCCALSYEMYPFSS